MRGSNQISERNRASVEKKAREINNSRVPDTQSDPPSLLIPSLC